MWNKGKKRARERNDGNKSSRTDQQLELVECTMTRKEALGFVEICECMCFFFGCDNTEKPERLLFILSRTK